MEAMTGLDREYFIRFILLYVLLILFPACFFPCQEVGEARFYLVSAVLPFLVSYFLAHL